MPFAGPTKVGTGSGAFAASWNTTVSGISVGDLIVVAIGGSFDAGVWSVTDDALNTYQVDAVLVDTSQHKHVAILSAPAAAVPTVVTTHDTTAGGNGGGTTIVYTVPGSDTTGTRVDQANQATAGNTATPSVSTLAATTNANDWIMAAFVGNTLTSPLPGAGYTQLDAVAANNSRGLLTEWKAVSATGVQSASMSNGTETYEAAIVAYKQAGGGSSPTPLIAPVVSTAVNRSLFY